MSRWTSCLALVVVLQLGTWSDGEEVFEMVLDGLSNPCAVAVQPGTGHVFVSDSDAGKVIRVVDGKPEDVITDFPRDIYGEEPKYGIGPLGLAFQDANTLVVGGGGMQDGDELVRIYGVPAAGSQAIPASNMKASLGPLAATDELQGEGNFYGVALTPADVFVTCNGDDTKGWVAKADITANGYGKLERFIATKEAVGVDAPVAVTIGPGGDVVIGQMGELTSPRDGLLSFYNAKSGRLRMNLRTELYDITSLAYSTKHPDRIYATDFAWMDSAQGGLYRLDAVNVDGKQAVKTVKIASLDKPTAMAFAPDGTLYVTMIGTADEGSDKKPGQLVRFSVGL